MTTDIEMGGRAGTPGTYVKVIATPGPAEEWNSDSFLVMYLRPNGTFLFLGYWPGFERSFAVGEWSAINGQVDLVGYGQIRGDALPNAPGGSFRRTLRPSVRRFTPILIAETELAGWSLLSWAGEYVYLGFAAILNVDGVWLPPSLAAVDEWIESNRRNR